MNPNRSKMKTIMKLKMPQRKSLLFKRGSLNPKKFRRNLWVTSQDLKDKKRNPSSYIPRAQSRNLTPTENVPHPFTLRSLRPHQPFRPKDHRCRRPNLEGRRHHPTSRGLRPLTCLLYREMPRHNHHREDPNHHREVLHHHGGLDPDLDQGPGPL